MPKNNFAGALDNPAGLGYGMGMNEINTNKGDTKMQVSVKTAEFRAMGKTVQRWRRKRGECIDSFMGRVSAAGVNIGTDNGNGDGTVRLADYNGHRGELRYK